MVLEPETEKTLRRKMYGVGETDSQVESEQGESMGEQASWNER